MSKILLIAKQYSVISIWDATYIYKEKSQSYDFQTVVFSAHKHRPLLKFMIIHATDGYIIDFVGPFLCHGVNNDAMIQENILINNQVICGWFNQDNIMVVDRGFRDSLS